MKVNPFFRHSSWRNPSLRALPWLLVLAGLAPLSAADWPQFRGPNASGIAPADAQPPVTWSETQNLKWKTPLPGPGSSSPIVVGDRVFVTCYSGYGDGGSGGSPEKLQRHLLCVERASGKILWDKSVPAELPEDPYTGYLTEHGYASSTPVSDGERVYVFFGKTGALAFDLQGNPLWKVNLGKESGNRHWGSGASPVLYKNTLIVTASEESRAVYALDKATGKQLWKADGSNLELCYSTPALVEAEGRTDLVLALPRELWGMNPDTGKLRWFANTSLSGNVSPTVVAAQGVIYASGGFPQLAAVAVRAGGKGDVSQTHLLWTSQNASYVPSPIVLGEHLYFATDQGFALCVKAKDGQAVFKERFPGVTAGGRGGKPFYASVVLAGGNLYAVSRRHGTFVFPAQPQFKLLAQNKLAGDDTDFNGTPALCGKQLLLRSNRALYCLE